MNITDVKPNRFEHNRHLVTIQPLITIDGIYYTWSVEPNCMYHTESDAITDAKKLLDSLLFSENYEKEG